VDTLLIQGKIEGLKTFVLPPNKNLKGETGSALYFLSGQDGIQLTSNNLIEQLHIAVDENKRAIYNDTQQTDLRYIGLTQLSTIGQVQILAKGKLVAGHVEVNGLDVIRADVLSQTERPHAWNVDILQGGLTIWSLHEDPKILLTANVVGFSAGRQSHPVLGCGVFVGGGGYGKSVLRLSRLETEAIYVDSKIPDGKPDVIGGGVFTVYGSVVEKVHNHGPVVVSGGNNDPCLDNWGEVGTWVVDAPLTVYGNSCFGFINFGLLNELIVNAPVETFGKGSRGFNVYEGRINYVQFDRITTHGDGAVGIAISKDVGRLVVKRGIETRGQSGESLYYGKLVELRAIPLQLKPGCRVGSIEVSGGLKATGFGMPPIEYLGGEVGSIEITGGLSAEAEQDKVGTHQ
jgi:hypothetical protein